MVEPSLPSTENQNLKLRAAEEKQRSDLQAIEMVLSIGDFQKQVDQPVKTQTFLKFITERINQLIKFDASAIYLVVEETSDIQLNYCVPPTSKNELEKQMAFLIANGYIAWAMREQRGIIVYSNDLRYRVLLHAIATSSRIRGLFIGLLPVKSKKLPNASLPALSLMLRNAANALESAEYIRIYQRQNAKLHKLVDEKVAELRRRDLQLMNAQKMDAISALAGGIAHQFNNALHALISNLDLIRIEAGDSRTINEYVDHIDAIAQGMSGLTLKLLAYARGGKYKPQKMSINDLVKETLKGLKKTDDGVATWVMKPPPDKYFVDVDATQMKLALTSIVTNAKEATEPGGRVRISWKKLPFEALPKELEMEEAADNYVALKIDDDGRGMDDKTLQRIFEPFFTTKFHGRGLSMAAVYGIVKNHNGSISVKSKKGTGTSVCIFLPMTD